MSEDFFALTADIVSAHVGNNTVAANELPTLISSVYKALAATTAPAAADAPKQEPAVSVRSSIKPDHIISLESGKKMKMLKRYLMTNYGMTPADYRAKWGLPKDYPMVAPNYAQQRKELALKIGLGRGGRRAASKPAAKAAPKKSAPKAKAPNATAASAAALKIEPKKAAVARGRSNAGTKAKSAKKA
jgi:predicted transcriptional regulator